MSFPSIEEVLPLEIILKNCLLFDTIVEFFYLMKK